VSNDLQVFDDEETTGLAIAPDDDDMGINETTMPTVDATPQPVIEVQLQPETMPLMEILPADFRLPVLTRFVPDPTVKARIDKALAYAKTIQIEGKGQDALARMDPALEELNAAIAVGEALFKEPAEIAFELHRHVTGKRAEWVNAPKAEVKSIGNAVWKETERLKEVAAAEQRRIQEEANAKARAEAAQAAADAEKNKAPAPIVEKLQQQAKSAVAPPVPAPTRPFGGFGGSSSSNTVVTTWKARLDSASEDAEEQAPALTSLSDAERADVLKLFKAIVDGRHDLLSLVSVNYGAINKLAVAQESTFNVPGFVAYKTGGTRKKAARRSR
jgi:hypothetical protein